VELAGELFFAHAGADAETLAECIEPRQLSGTKRHLFIGGAEPEGPIESCVGLKGTGEVQRRRDARERASFVAEEECPFVAMPMFRHALGCSWLDLAGRP
jgi:hypothetical protein